MEQPSGRGQQAAWTAGFQRIYLSRLVAMLHRGKLERATSVLARSRTIKFAADLSLATTSIGRTAWSRAIICKYLFRLNNRVANSRGNSHGKKRSVTAKAKRRKPNAACDSSGRQKPGTESRLRVTTELLSRDNGDEEAGGNVASRMQVLRTLVPGSLGLDTPVFLKEAADYIVALKMQVQAMQALVDCYSNSNAGDARHFSI